MSTVGYATLPVIPSLRGMEREIQQQLGGLTAIADRIGGDSGRGFMARFGANVVSGLDQLGGTIVRWASRGFMAAGAAAGALVATGLWGGLQRALDREDAIVTFRRMGLDDASISQLTDAIDEALRGTPITNPEGFALAGRFLAQGFDTADIPGIVSTIADMATVGNRSFGEMADVLVSAAGQGRITAAELNRLGDLPLGKVAAELGMTEAQLREMVSSGELTAETFIEAFAAIDEFSGAARDATTRVAWQNLKTQIASIGEQFVGPLLGENGAAQRALLALRERIGDLGPAAANAGQAFADWLVPAVQSAAEWFEDRLIPALKEVWDWFSRNRDVIRDVIDAAAPVAGWIGAIAVAVNILSRFTPFGLLITAIFALATGIRYAWENSETFRNVVTGAWEAVKTVVGAVVDFLVGAFETVVGWFTNIGESSEGTVAWLGETWGQAAGIFSTVIEIVQELWRHFSTAFDAVREVVTAWFDWFEPLWSAVWDGIVAHLGVVWDTIKSLITSALDFIQGYLDVVLGLITGDWERVWDGIRSMFEAFRDAMETIARAVWDTIRNIFTTGLNAIRDMFIERFGWLIAWAGGIPGRFMAAIASLIGRGTVWARDVVASMRRAFEERFAALIVFFRGLPDRVIAAIRGLIARGLRWARDVVASMRRGFVDAFNGVLAWFRGLPQRILSALGNVGRMLYNAGRQVIRGFADGIRDAAGSVTSAVGGVMSQARNLMPFSPAKEGPFSGRGWTLYAGQAIAEALAAGINQRSQLVEAAAYRLAQMARAQMAPLMAGPVTASTVGSDGAAALGRGDMNFNGPISLGSRDDFAEFQQLIRKMRLEMGG